MSNVYIGSKTRPEDIFSHVCYGSKKVNGKRRRNYQKNIDLFRDAGTYIEEYTQTSKPHYPLEHYNFSGFLTNKHEHSLETLGVSDYIKEKIGKIIGTCGVTQRIRFVSETINDTLSIQFETGINSILKGKKLYRDREVGVLATQIYPDGEYMITLNYQDFPVGYLSYDINEGGEPIIVQLQSGKVVEVPFYHFSTKHHLVDGFNWQKVLINFFEDYLKEQGYKGKIHIQNAEAHEYYESAKQERMHLTYDETAKSMGYSQAINGTYFIKNI